MGESLSERCSREANEAPWFEVYLFMRPKITEDALDDWIQILESDNPRMALNGFMAECRGQYAVHLYHTKLQEVAA